MHALNELRKARAEGLEKARDPELAFVTRGELEAALGPIRGALELSEPAPDCGNPLSRPAAGLEAESLESAELTETVLSGSDKAETKPTGKAKEK